MQRTVRYCAIAAIVIPISAAHFDVAHALSGAPALSRGAARACGKELIKQCSEVPVQAKNMLECLLKNQENLSKRCAGLAHTVVRRCDRDAARLCQSVVAGQGNILGCLTTAKQSVSRRCNAALDAAFLRQ